MKVGVVAGGSVVAAWQAACIDALRALDGVTVTVAFGGEAWRPPPARLAWLAGRAMRPVTVAADAGGLDGADVVVDLSGGAANREAPAGVWTFRLGEDDDRRAPFVREIGRGDTVVEIELIRRSGARREQLRLGRFPVTRWYPSTLAWSLNEAARWPALFAAAVRDGRPIDVAAALPPRPAARPSRAERLRFSARLGARFAGYVPARLFERAEWNVGFVAGGPRRLLDDAPLDVQWLERPPAGTFVADPFIVERDGRRALFVEQYAEARGHGVIDVLELDDRNGIVRRDRIIESPTHLSYPYPLEIDGALYLVPESSAGNEVALYRCVEFPTRWERELTLFPAFDGVDATIFAHEGRWWAFCTRASDGPDYALHAYFADTPRGRWTAHPLNPVVVDVARARPAGRPFVVDGVLYRPGQDCSETYGGGLAIARVDALSPQTYRETVVRRVTPQTFGRYADGVHTVDFAADAIVLDGKHIMHDLWKPVWGLSKAGGRLARWCAPSKLRRAIR